MRPQKTQDDDFFIFSESLDDRLKLIRSKSFIRVLTVVVLDLKKVTSKPALDLSEFHDPLDQCHH